MKKAALLLLFVLFLVAFSSASLLPIRCTFSPELYCLDFSLSGSNARLDFLVRNDAGSDAAFNFAVTELASNTSVDCGCLSPLGCNARSGEVMNVSCQFPKDLFAEPAAKYKFDARVNLTASDGVPKSFSGEIYGMSEASLKAVQRERMWQSLYPVLGFLAVLAAILALLIWKRKSIGVVWFWLGLAVLVLLVLLMFYLGVATPIVY